MCLSKASNNSHSNSVQYQEGLRTSVSTTPQGLNMSAWQSMRKMVFSLAA